MLKLSKYIVPVMMTVAVAGCNDPDAPTNNPVELERTYQVSITNLTNAQPFSPVAVLLHDTGDVWQVGQPASNALEKMAESGDNSDLLNLDFVIDQATNGEVVFPGAMAEIMISTTSLEAKRLSIATMLVNSNDAFTGLNAIDLSYLDINQMISFNVASYDAGTESNSEMLGTIPGPADGGTGFDPIRDDVNYVARHPGIVSSDDGLSSSVLTNEHKFDNPTMSVKIVRIQ